MKLTINELLLNRGLKSSDSVKFVRHKDHRTSKVINGCSYKESLYNLYRNEFTKPLFIQYQCEQSKHVFKGVDYIVSFIGEERTLARFIGVYKITGYTHKPDCAANFLYEMEEVSGFEDIKERVIIDWGTSTLSWHQWMSNEKRIIEIGMPLNHVQFKSYDAVILDRSQFEEIFKGQYPEWKRALSAVNGVYLILDKKTGLQYIGSTYGKEGIWGRWKGYYKSIHNENRKLVDLLSEDINYKYNFQYTILQVLPLYLSDKEAITYESIYKRKLGSRAFGLNSN